MESIHPNDIMTLDMDSISYVTLKNGNMILIDDTVPQKSNTEKKNIPISSSLNQNESKVAPKEMNLEISSPLIISFEGTIDPNKYKSDFKLCSEIVQNTNFCFDGIKNNNNYNNTDINNNYNDKDDKINLKSNKEIKGILNNNNNNDNEISYSNRHSLKESENKPITNIKYNYNNNNNNNNNNNENEDNFSKMEKSEYNQSNMNTNLSIPLMNLQNNPENKSSINEIRKKRASRIFGGTGRKSRISINAVCSLNIKAEEKYTINLINQFNGIVDKLNAERDKKPIYDITENENDFRNIKYYEYYKNKNQNKFKKNLETMNQNYILNTNSNYSKKKEGSSNFNTLSNYYRKSMDFNGSKNNDFKNTLFRDSFGKSPAKYSSNKIKNFRDKIYKYSSELVLPSNKIK